MDFDNFFSPIFGRKKPNIFLLANIVFEPVNIYNVYREVGTKMSYFIK